MPPKSAMDGSDGPPSRYNAVGLLQDQPYHTRGRSSQHAGGSYQQGERDPLLGRYYDAGLESGLLVDRSPKTNRHLLAILAILFVCLGYTLNSLFHSTYYEAVEQAWARKLEKHQALRIQMNRDEAVWEERRARHEEQERQRREDEIKKREGISWEGLAAARCSRYATREYTAVLANVPLGFDALEECRKKPVNIHGRDLLPSRCEDQGVCGRVTGHWDVDFAEPGCVTWWRWFDDKVKSPA
ncbi:hypothetical protein M413DRAFT_422993 [Hebeloma cylindrosporum]|uniref:Uncharacterized protein n=1 Tax=Hebeloma cylindrosporum TaxID=76867 RepID=A0A0C3CT38_HEBCY|nr:hypothetical protein M413DRAFT_422993 [Hebeloma cylindrosporum h7]